MIAQATVLGWSLFAVCAGFVVAHSWREGRITLLDWSILAMGGVYGAGWAAVVQVTHRGDNPVWEAWIRPFVHLYPLHTAMAVVLLGAVCLGWAVAGSLRIVPPTRHRTSPSSPAARWITAFWILLGSAIVLQGLYTRAYGGYSAYLNYSLLMRAGLMPVSNPFSFLQPFGGLALFASFGFFGLVLSRHRSFAVVTGLVLSIAFSIYILFSWMGRISFAVYPATFMLGALLSRRSSPMTVLFGGGSAMLAVLAGAYWASILLDLKPSQDLPTFLGRELAFPFASFFAQLDSGEHLFRGFRDLLVAPAYLLPSSIWMNWVDDVSWVNTTVLMGARKGTQGITAGVPVDLLTLGLMQASLWGVAGVGILFGGILRALQDLLEHLPNPGVRAVLEAYLVLKIAVLGCFYAQPSLVVAGNFDLLVSVATVVVVLRLPRRLWRAPVAGLRESA